MMALYVELETRQKERLEKIHQRTGMTYKRIVSDGIDHQYEKIIGTKAMDDALAIIGKVLLSLMLDAPIEPVSKHELFTLMKDMHERAKRNNLEKSVVEIERWMKEYK